MGHIPMGPRDRTEGHSEGVGHGGFGSPQMGKQKYSTGWFWFQEVSVFCPQSPDRPGSERIFPRKREEERGGLPRRKGSRLVVGMNGNMATEKEKDAHMKQSAAEIQAAKGHGKGG